MEDNSNQQLFLSVLKHPSFIGLVSSLGMSFSFYALFSKKLAEQSLRQQRYFESQEENGQTQVYINEQNKFKQQQLQETLMKQRHQRYSHVPQNEIRVHKICITGGPCGGKTTGIAYLTEKLKEIYNIPVFVIPEAATMMAKGGCMIRTNEYQDQGAVEFQHRLLQLQMSIEEQFIQMAKLQSKQSSFKEQYLDQQHFAKDVVLIMDRGLMDGRAYLEQEQWQTMLDQYNMNEVYLRDRRYDLVLHMVTAADGAEKFYNLSNNIARYESDLQEAVDCDKRTQLAWIGHPQFKIIENREDQSFQQKLDFLLYNVKVQVGLADQENSSYKQITRKFIVDANVYHNKIRENDTRVQTYMLKDTYLLDYFAAEEGDHQVRHRIKVRKRGNHRSINNNYCYIYSSKQQKGSQSFSKRKNIISAQDYSSYLQNTDDRRKSIIIKRTTFMTSEQHSSKYYFLDEYKNLNLPLAVLKIKVNVSDAHCKLDVPNLFKIYKEITGNRAYSSHNIAKNDYYVVNEDKNFFINQIEMNPKNMTASPMEKQRKNSLVQ